VFVDGRPRPRKVPALPDVAPAELEDGSIVPLGELERLMCDCETTRIVMDARGLPMDVGQTQRTYTKELRRAVTTRDRRCQWPGCSIRASWCEVHHLWWFSKGGPTSVQHGLTVCSFHHHRIHREHVDVTVLGDGFDFHHRDGRHIGTTRRPSARERARSGGTRPSGSEDGLSPALPVPGSPADRLLAAWPPGPGRGSAGEVLGGESRAVDRVTSPPNGSPPGAPSSGAPPGGDATTKTADDPPPGCRTEQTDLWDGAPWPGALPSPSPEPPF
jgi:hypothetical protein